MEIETVAARIGTTSLGRSVVPYCGGGGGSAVEFFFYKRICI
jgi:hypothetical protein